MFQTKKKREAVEEPPQDDLLMPDSWKRLRPGLVNDEEQLVFPGDARKRKLSDVEPFGAWPPSRSLTDQEEDEEDNDGLGGMRLKRVSLDGPMVLRLCEKEDDGGGREMDWEGAGATPERAGYYARAEDEEDYNHPYRDMNRVLYGCYVMRDERK